MLLHAADIAEEREAALCREQRIGAVGECSLQVAGVQASGGFCGWRESRTGLEPRISALIGCRLG